jgi:hypothetical protein
MIKRAFFLFAIFLSTVTSAWARAEQRNRLENIAAALSHQNILVTTATEEIGSFRSDLKLRECDVHWQSIDPDGSYITCLVSYEDKYFRGSGEVTVDASQGQIKLRLHWQKPSSYLVKLDLTLIRPANQITWHGDGVLQAHYRFKIWNDKYWQIDLRGRANF